MTRILYPVLVEPILPPSQEPEQRQEARWHQPISTPVLRVALTAAVIAASSGAVAPILPPEQEPEQRQESRWHQPLAQPTLRGGLSTALISASGEAWSPTLPSLSLLWQQPFSQPVAAKPAISSGATQAPIPPATIGWFAAISQPTVRPAPQQTSPGFVYPPAEVITLDKWYQPLTGPRFPNGLPTAEQPYFSFAKAAPFAETVTADRWFQPLSLPRTQAAVQQVLAALVYAPAETVTLDKWFQPFGQKLMPGGMPVAEQPYYAFVKAAPFAESVSVDRWLRPLSEPITSRRTPRAVEFPALSYAYAIIAAPPPSTSTPEGRIIHFGQLMIRHS